MVHLFVADDSELIRKAIKTVIETQALNVTQSRDKMAAVRDAKQDGSEIVFLDIQLPDEQGLEAVYDIINSIPEAKVDVFKPDQKEPIPAKSGGDEAKTVNRIVMKKTDLDRIIEKGLECAVKSVSQLINKEMKFGITQEHIIKKGNIVQVVPRTCLGVYYELTGDTDGSTSLMFPLNDILATVGLFQLDFTVQEGTTQNIINELGNIFINHLLAVLDENMRKKFSLGVPVPANGDNIDEQFNRAGRNDDDIVILKFNFMVEDRSIDSYLLLSIGRVIS